jgi:hypothetical protein
MTRIIVTSDVRGSEEQRILLDEEVRPEHMSDKHSALQLLERLGWAVSDAEHAPAASYPAPGPWNRTGRPDDQHAEMPAM